MSAEMETAYLIQNVVRKSGWIELPAEGNSMYPFIQSGDLCHFRSCNPSLLKKGDIVLYFSSHGKLIAHRFHQVRTYQDRSQFIFKGDTNLGFDEPIVKEQIIGKLTSIQKGRTKMNVSLLPVCLWGKLILTFPILSGLLRGHLERKPVG